MYRHFEQPYSTQYPSPWVLKPIILTLLLALLIGTLHSMSVYSPAPWGPTPASASTAPGPAEPRVRTWQTGVVYLQVGSSCVGYALVAWLDSAPHPAQNHPDGLRLYLASQDEDGVAGPHEGTTMDAGIRVLARMGYVSTWQSTQDADKSLSFLRTQGPILLDGEFPTERPHFDGQNNLLWMGKTARHAWLCYAVDDQDRLSCQNSGGTSWNHAEGGRFHMSYTALVHVLARGLAWLVRKS